MNRPARASLLIVVIALGLGLMALLGSKFSDRRELLKYKAELRAKGEKLSFAELNPTAQTSVNDSLIQFTNALSRVTYSRLSPSTLEVRKFVGPAKARVLWKEEKPFGLSSGTLGSAAGWQEFSQELKKYEGATADLRESLKGTQLEWSSRTSVWQQAFPSFVSIRVAAQWLMGTAEAHLQEGKNDAALEDLEALAGVARMNRNDCTLVSQMIRVAVAGLGAAVTWEALQATNWTEAQLARLQKAWEAVDLGAAGENGYVGERAIGEDLWQAIRRGNRSELRKQLSFGGSTNLTFRTLAQDYVMLPLYKITSMDMDELFRLKQMERYIETARAVRAHRPWLEAKQPQDRAMAEINRISSSPGSVRYWFSMVSIPNFVRANQTSMRSVTEWQMTITAIALERYKMRHGDYPERLEVMMPEVISSMPYDCFSGKSLNYQRKADGTFLLYSVGEDCKDDGGDATGGKTGIWDGVKDAVWPSAAK